jgi:hypothetical protein
MAQQRGYEIVQEYTDRISGAKARRPGLDDIETAAAATLTTECGKTRCGSCGKGSQHNVTHHTSVRLGQRPEK